MSLLYRIVLVVVLTSSLAANSSGPENGGNYANDFRQAWLNAVARDSADKIYLRCLEEVRACGAFEKTFSLGEIQSMGKPCEIERVIKVVREEIGLDVTVAATSITVSWAGVCEAHSLSKKADLNAEVNGYKKRLIEAQEARSKKQREYDAWVNKTVDAIWQYCLEHLTANTTKWSIPVKERFGHDRDYKDVIQALHARGMQVKEIPAASGYDFGDGSWSTPYELEIEYIP